MAAGESVTVNFQMGTEALGLDEIVVTGSRRGLSASRGWQFNCPAQRDVGEHPNRQTPCSCSKPLLQEFR